MSFSYNTSIDAWTPAWSADKARFRILELHPPDPLSPAQLHATLTWALLRSAARPLSEMEVPDKDEAYPVYKALSYTWGNDKTTQDIYVNGSKLPITTSLYSALIHLRPESDLMKIWIDQICINQEDRLEKEEQVGFMGRIYRNCEEALVWLGPAANESDDVFDLLNKVGVFAKKLALPQYYPPGNYQELHAIETQVDPKDPKTVEYHDFCDRVIPEFTAAFLTSLIALYKRPWFCRAWVVQEFSLPSRATFVCGHKTIDAEILSAVLNVMHHNILGKMFRTLWSDQHLMSLSCEVSDLRTFEPLFLARRRHKAYDQGRITENTLYQMLQKVCVEQKVRATQGCDLVYGLLGLVSDADRLNIVADYTEEDQDVQAVRAYTHTAKAIIESGKVDLLMFAQHPKQDLLLPSWVPDWRSELQRSFAWLRDESQRPLFRPSAGQALQLCESGDKRVLALMGYKVDTVEDVGDVWYGDNRDDDSKSPFPYGVYIKHLSQVRQMCVLSAAKGTDVYPNSQRRDEALWRIPVGDIDQDDDYGPLRATKACECSYDHCVAEMELLQLESSGTAREGELKARAAEVEAMGRIRNAGTDGRVHAGQLYRTRMETLQDKRPFLSHMGYVGMGPSCMQPGDMIVVLSGASVPFIVRPMGDDKFRFLGECYCDGIMDGEIVDKRIKEKIILW